MKHLFNYEWTLKDANFTKDKGTVFSCFACGGGSTMGYKLAGFDVIGCNEIDPKMMEAYRVNHNPKFSYLEPIQEFKKREDLPKELFNLDILDGSPPCSSFSMAGNREKDWGKDKKFREGQAEQVLDTLFFDFLDLGEKLQPKVIIAENVKGLLMGDAQKYVDKILTRFDEIGYYVDFKLLNAAKMGVPQRRERVFFYAMRKDLYKGGFEDLFATRPILDLEFDEKDIKFREVEEFLEISDLSKVDGELWDKRLPGDKHLGEISERERGILSRFSAKIIHSDIVVNTILSENMNVLYNQKRKMSDNELILCGSYPGDYNFLTNKVTYLVGMSVPPVMTAQIATRIYKEWLSWT